MEEVIKAMMDGGGGGEGGGHGQEGAWRGVEVGVELKEREREMTKGRR